MTERTVRDRKLSEKFRNVDSATLAEAATRQLDALEDDNHAAEREAEIGRDDDEFLPTGGDSEDDADSTVFTKGAKKRRASSAKKGKRGKGATRADRKKRRKGSDLSDTGGKPNSSGSTNIERWNMTLANMLQREPLSSEERPANMVHFDAMTARPSKKPSRPFCVVCGFNASYTCRQCGARFCSIPCDTVHQQAQCLKFIS